jgi:hypothetical protein
MIFMGAPSLENDLYIYWLQLSEDKKQELITVAKHLADSKEEVTIPDNQWDLILQERERHYNSVKGYTWEEVKEMARDKSKRHGLPS